MNQKKGIERLFFIICLNRKVTFWKLSRWRSTEIYASTMLAPSIWIHQGSPWWQEGLITSSILTFRILQTTLNLVLWIFHCIHFRIICTQCGWLNYYGYSFLTITVEKRFLTPHPNRFLHSLLVHKPCFENTRVSIPSTSQTRSSKVTDYDEIKNFENHLRASWYRIVIDVGQ